MAALGTLVLAALSAAPYGPGEKMDFSVRYLGLRVGVASISSAPLDEAQVNVQLEAKTVGIGSLYNLDERIQTVIAPTTGLPIRSRIDADEKGRKHQEVTTFDRGAGTATVRKERTRDGALRVHSDVVQVPPDATSLLALVYRLRALPLEPGQRHAFAVLSGNKLRHVEAAVLGREELVTRAGTFTTLKIRVPTGFSGKFSEKNPTLLWLSDDPRRIVVRLSTDFAIGQAVAELKSYQPPTPAPDEGFSAGR